MHELASDPNLIQDYELLPDKRGIAAINGLGASYSRIERHLLSV